MKLCLGCMQELDENTVTCPYCGFNEKTLRQESYYLKLGTIIAGKYIVGQALQYGGYTVRYIGLDAEKNRKVMISEYLPSDFSTRSGGDNTVTIYSGDALEQFNQGLVTFLNEGNRIQSLGKPEGIACVYDCVSENDTGYVITEYTEGQTLQEILDSGKLFQPEEAACMICEILNGLSKLHPQDIIHCDIAPENILLTQDGRIKLLNFGSARYVTTANSKSLAIILKQGYAPEEQYRSMGKRGPWTDVYALGAVMYRMITGKVPQESVDRTLEDNLDVPSKMGISISAGMENALMNALNIYQSDRTSDAEHFYQELRNPNTVRKKVKIKKRETGKLPVWVKGLVAVVACAVIVGGVVLVKQQMAQKEQEKKTGQNKFSQNIGMTLNEWEAKWKEYKYDMKDVQIEYRYDSGIEDDKDEVKDFVDLTKGDLLGEGKDFSALEKLQSDETKTEKKDEEHLYEKGKLAKIIVASRKEVTLLEWWKDNCSGISSDKVSYESAGLPEKYVEEGENEDESYGVIEYVEITEENGEKKQYVNTDLKEYKNNKNALSGKFGQSFSLKDIKVVICNGDYYRCPFQSFQTFWKRKYKEKPPKQAKEFIKKNIRVEELKIFQFGKNKDFKENKKLKSGKNYYAQNYVSFEYSTGTIMEVGNGIKESLLNGKDYDAKEHGTTELFDTVGEKLDYSKKTVSEVKAYLEKQYDVTVKRGGFPNDYIVKNIDVKTFKKNVKTTITITDAEPESTPPPTKKPTQQNKQSQQNKSNKSQSGGNVADDDPFH